MAGIINVANLLVKFSANTKDLEKGLGETKQSVSKMSTALKGMALGAVAAFAALGASAVAAGAKLAINAAQVEGIGVAFRATAEDADTMLAALREGAGGMTSDIELMKQYNQAAQLVGKTFAESLPEAMGALQKIAASTGQSMDYLTSSLITGTARASKMILDNLNITVSWADAYADFAKEAGKTVSALTLQEKKTARVNHVTRLLKENTEGLSGLAGTAQQSWAGFQASLTNIKDEVGNALLPAFKEIVDVAQDASKAIAEFVRGEAFQAAMARLAKAVKDFTQSIRDIDPEIKEAVKNLLHLAAALGKITAPFSKFAKAAQSQRFHQIAGDVNEVSEGFKMLGGWIDKARGVIEGWAFLEQVDKVETALRNFVSFLPGGAEALDAFGLAHQATAASTGAMAAQAALNESALRAETAAMRESAAAAREKAAGAVRDEAAIGAYARGAEMIEAYAAEVQARKATLQTLVTATQEAYALMKTTESNHWQSMSQIRQQSNMDSLNMQFDYNLQRAMAEQEYQAQRAGLVAAGRTDEVAKLDANHKTQEGMAERDYKIQEQLQARAILIQKIAAQRAYVEQLKMQYEKIKIAVGLATTEATDKGKVDLAGQIELLRLDIWGGTEQNKVFIEFAEARVTGFAEANKSILEDGVATTKGLIALQGQDLSAAEAHLRELEEKLKTYHIDMPPIPEPDMSGIDGVGLGLDSAMTRATEPVTKTIAQTAQDIDAGIKAAKSALKELVGLALPEGYEEGLEKLNTFFSTAFTKLRESIDMANEQAKGFGEAIASLMGGLTSALALFKELRGYVDPAEEEVYRFQRRLVMMMQDWHRWLTSEELGKGYDSEIVTEFSAGVNGLMGGLASALKFFKELPGFLAMPDSMVSRFQRRVVSLMQDWHRWLTSAELGEGYDAKIVSDFGAGITGLMKGLAEALELFTALSDFVDLPDQLVYEFQHRLVRLMDEWHRWLTRAELGKGYNSKLVSVFGQSIQSLVGGMKGALELFGGLATYVATPEARFAQFRADLGAMLTGWNEWLSGPALEIDVGAITTYMRSLDPIIAMTTKIGAVFEKMYELSKTAGPTWAGIGVWRDMVVWLMEEISILANRYGTGALADATRFRDVMVAVAEAIQAGNFAVAGVAGINATANVATQGVGVTSTEPVQHNWHIVLDIPALGMTAEGDVTEETKNGEREAMNMRLTASAASV